MGTPEQAVIDAAVAGDRAALGELLRAIDADLRRTISIDQTFRAVLSVEDVLQVTYLEIGQDIGGFRNGSPTSFVAWCRLMAKRNMLDAIKSLRAGTRPPPARRINAGHDGGPDPVEYQHDDGRSPSSLTAGDERRQALLAAIELLPELYGRVIHMCDLNHMPVAECAKAMDRNPGAVHMLLARARERLQSILGRESNYYSS